MKGVYRLNVCFDIFFSFVDSWIWSVSDKIHGTQCYGHVMYTIICFRAKHGSVAFYHVDFTFPNSFWLPKRNILSGDRKPNLISTLKASCDMGTSLHDLAKLLRDTYKESCCFKYSGGWWLDDDFSRRSFPSELQNRWCASNMTTSSSSIRLLTAQSGSGHVFDVHVHQRWQRSIMYSVRSLPHQTPCHSSFITSTDLMASSATTKGAISQSDKIKWSGAFNFCSAICRRHQIELQSSANVCHRKELVHFILFSFFRLVLFSI